MIVSKKMIRKKQKHITLLPSDHLILFQPEGADNAQHIRSVNLKSIFSWNSIAQKINEIFDKFLPYEARAKFYLTFRSFWGEWNLKKILLRFTDLYYRPPRFLDDAASLQRNIVTFSSLVLNYFLHKKSKATLFSFMFFCLSSINVELCQVWSIWWKR